MRCFLSTVEYLNNQISFNNFMIFELSIFFLVIKITIQIDDLPRILVILLLEISTIACQLNFLYGCCNLFYIFM